MEPEESDEQMSPETGTIQRQEESSQEEDENLKSVQPNLPISPKGN
jgi:hypothetical protein